MLLSVLGALIVSFFIGKASRKTTTVNGFDPEDSIRRVKLEAEAQKITAPRDLNELVRGMNRRARGE